MSTTSSWTSRSYWPAKGFAALFDYAAGSSRRAAAVLALISLIAFLPGIFQIPRSIATRPISRKRPSR